MKNVFVYLSSHKNVRGLMLRHLFATLLVGILCPLSVMANDAVAVNSVDQAPRQDKEILLRGQVTDKEGLPLPGVAVQVKGTSQGVATDVDGNYYIMVKGVETPTLVFSYVGMKTQEIAYVKGQHRINVTMEEDANMVEEVVVTGMFTRKAESFTGSARTMTKEELKRVGSSNLFQSLKNLDPSLQIMDNYAMGSDPNALPDMRMRGTSSFTGEMDGTLRGNYQSDPNQPLIILDGFESTLEAMLDLDMDRVQSITLLKDAASKAIYGSKAANGVLVIETVGLPVDGVRVTYNGNLDLEMPDLTSYNLCNSLEKLQVEMLEGKTYDLDVAEQMELYYTRLKKAKEGFDQYWLSLPLRVGIGQKHNLQFEMGTNEVKTLFSVSYNDVQGVMKDSYRRTFAGTAQITYRKGKLQFRDIATITSNNTQDSPYGTFSEYAKMNPYQPAYNEDGSLLKQPDGGLTSPLYNSTTNSKSQTSYLNFTNNFSIEYRPFDGMTLKGSLGLTTKRSDGDRYYSNLHTMFANYSNDMLAQAGSYTLNYGKSNTISARIQANYVKTIKEHTFFADLGWSLDDTQYKELVNKAEGYMDSAMDEYIFGSMYEIDGSPSGNASKRRSLGITGVFGYTYDERYLFDGTIRANASSAFGEDKPWATFWSVGLGWNLHNEAFLKDVDWLEMLKIRASLGYTGNENFQTNKSASTYNYYLEDRYTPYWTGLYVNNMRNPSLEWELKKDLNIGFDFKWRNRLSFSFDWYRSDTENLVTSISIPGSTAFTSVSENLGLVRNQGVEISMSVTPLKHRDYHLTFSANLATNDNKLLKLSDAMRTFNETQQKLFDEYSSYNGVQTSPVNMYYEGMHMNTIWAVPSIGIDPSDGYEAYIDKDGNITKMWKAENLVAAGVADHKWKGNFGFNGEYKGLGMSVVFRFQGGGQLYNQTLVDRVENVNTKYNVDRRVLTGRWNTPGVASQYRRIYHDSENYHENLIFVARYQGDTTRPTTRFVQDNNELTLSAVSVYYDLPKKWLRTFDCERLRIQANMNDICTWSTIGIERGTNYPFARTLSFSLSATF